MNFGNSELYIVVSREPPEDPEILPWLEQHHREDDWVEQANITNQMKNNADEGLFHASTVFS